jgi:hypothetical protein
MPRSVGVFRRAGWNVVAPAKVELLWRGGVARSAVPGGGSSAPRRPQAPRMRAEAMQMARMVTVFMEHDVTSLMSQGSGEVRKASA